MNFCNYLTYSVDERLFKLLCRVLEMDDDYLWEHVQSKVGPVGQGYFRQALYYASDEDVSAKSNGTRMNG